MGTEGSMKPSADIKVRRPSTRSLKRALLEDELGDNSLASRMTIELTKAMDVRITMLFESGLYGTSRQGVVEELLRHRLRELELEGWTK